MEHVVGHNKNLLKTKGFHGFFETVQAQSRIAREPGLLNSALAI